MPLIDRYVAAPDFRERHATNVNADAETALAIASAYRTEDDPFFRGMIGLREFPMRVIRKTVGGSSGSQLPFGIDNFTLLEANKSEIVYGLAGRFWSLDYGLEKFSGSAEFLAIKTPGSAKLALNFAVGLDGDGKTILSTETRIACADAAARRRFAPYWYLIRPVSGLIRRRTLNAIRRSSEAKSYR